MACALAGAAQARRAKHNQPIADSTSDLLAPEPGATFGECGDGDGGMEAVMLPSNRVPGDNQAGLLFALKRHLPLVSSAIFLRQGRGEIKT